MGRINNNIKIYLNVMGDDSREHGEILQVAAPAELMISPSWMAEPWELKFILGLDGVYK